MAAAAPRVQTGDVVLISNLAVQCLITPPAPVFGISVVPKSSTVSSFDYDLSWRSYTNPGVIAYSDRVGMIVASDQTGTGSCVLATLHGDGSAQAFGVGFQPGGPIYGIAPTATDVFVLGTGPSSFELWRVSPTGELLARIPIPISKTGAGGPSLDIAADQCTVFYAARNTVGRYDACTQSALPDFTSTDGILGNVRIAPDGEVLAIDRVTSQLLRFSRDGQLRSAFSLPLIAAENEYVSAFAFDETGGKLWVATSFRCLGTSGTLDAGGPDIGASSKRD